MVVRDKVRTEPPHEGARYTQIAVLEDGVVVEHFVTSAASASLVGNIYLGIVQNVLPSMEAAFVDIGRGRNGVLYAGEVNWEAAGLGGAQRKIEQALKPGDYVVVQVSKDPVGHKGARLTTQVSLAGRYLVYVPGASSTGISRKLPDTERQRLKEILREVVPAEAGVIIRTASEGVKEEDIRTDVNRLQERWTQIEAKAAETKKKAAGAAIALYEEPDVLVKVIRDLFNEDFTGLIVSGDEAWNTINEYVNSVAPELVPRMTKYEPAAGRPGRVRGAPHRRAADQGDGPQGVAAVGRHAGDRPHRGDDRRRRQHRQVHRFGWQPGADGHPQQPRGRRGDRAPAAAARHRRHRRHRLHRHGPGIQPRSGAASADRGAGPRPHPPSGVRGDVAGVGAADPKEVGHRADRGVLDEMPALRRARDPAARRSRRLGVDELGRKPESGGRRGKRGKRGGKAEDVAVAKVPAHPPASIRCSRRWPRPTAVTRTTTRATARARTKAAEEVAEVDPDTIREAVVETAEEDLDEDDDFEETDEDESDEDESDEDEIDLDDDDEDEDIDDDDIEVIDDDSDDDEDADDDSDSDDDEDSDEDDDEDDDDSDEDDDFEEAGEPVPVSPPAGRASSPCRRPTCGTADTRELIGRPLATRKTGKSPTCGCSRPGSGGATPNARCITRDLR